MFFFPPEVLEEGYFFLEFNADKFYFEECDKDKAKDEKDGAFADLIGKEC